MENNRYSSNKKCLSSGEEKLIREVDYDLVAGSLPLSPPTSLDLEILQRVRRVLISIKPKTRPIETLFVANKSDVEVLKESRKSASHLGTGDFTSAQTRFSDVDESSNVTSSNCHQSISEKLTQHSSSALSTTLSENESYNKKKNHRSYKKSCEKCFIFIQPQPVMKYRFIDAVSEKQKIEPINTDKTLVVDEKSSSQANNSAGHLSNIQRRLNHLEKKVLKQEMVFRCLDINDDVMSTDEEASKENVESNVSEAARPGCSYIQQYNHIPETSAFHRSSKMPFPQEYSNSTENLRLQQTTTPHSFDKTILQNTNKKYQNSMAQSSEGTTRHFHRQQHSAPLTAEITSPLEKGHNSEQYGRHFTTYDGLTARGKRHSASVPVKRIEVSTMAAERIQRIRQKLNPVRDYRLMDTVHYLAQGEFAPRDDGIKLTPSREAVLSDIVWEDVCRTHWPNARLSRRTERSPRGELQRQIDNLLRERVAHVERRRRRHYKIIKLNSHRHDNCKPVGKTGDIIVAAKNNPDERERDTNICHHHYKHVTSRCSEKHRFGSNMHKPHHSHNHQHSNDTHDHDWTTTSQCECAPGPSSINPKTPKNREASCYFHTYKHKPALSAGTSPGAADDESLQQTSRNHSVKCDGKSKSKISAMKRELSRRKHQKEDPSLDHFILLPTLVARTPSNLIRQKKFNALYHRILKLNMHNQTDCAAGSDSVTPAQKDKKDIGLNSTGPPHSDIED